MRLFVRTKDSGVSRHSWMRSRSSSGPRLAPPNNQNIMADFQNRYVLLEKGLRFIDSITGTASGQEKAK